MSAITAKEIKLLQVLAKGEPVIAPFDSFALCGLRRMGFAAGISGRTAAGKLHNSNVWSITDRGRRFLDEERAGR